MSGCFLMRVFFGGIYPTDDVFVIILFFYLYHANVSYGFPNCFFIVEWIVIFLFK
jgi:hypothetical protein